jgi:hypothetical protein
MNKKSKEVKTITTLNAFQGKQATGNYLWLPMGSYGFLYFFPPILKQTGCFAGRHDEEVPSGTSAHAARSCAPTARAGKAKRFFTGSMRKTKTNLGSKSLVSIHFRYSLKNSQIFQTWSYSKRGMIFFSKSRNFERREVSTHRVSHRFSASNLEISACPRRLVIATSQLWPCFRQNLRTWNQDEPSELHGFQL